MAIRVCREKGLSRVGARTHAPHPLRRGASGNTFPHWSVRNENLVTTVQVLQCEMHSTLEHAQQKASREDAWAADQAWWLISRSGLPRAGLSPATK